MLGSLGKLVGTLGVSAVAVRGRGLVLACERRESLGALRLLRCQRHRVGR